MSRRLPSSLAHQLKSCKLYATGQRCANCPSKHQKSCPLPDIEDCLLPRHLAAKTPSTELVCENSNEATRSVSINSIFTKAGNDVSPVAAKKQQPMMPGCMRLLASVPATPALKGVPSRGMKIIGPQKAPELSVLAEPSQEPLVSADPFDLFRALRRARDLEEAVAKKERSLVSLSSSEGKAMFQEAMASGGMENYFDLATHHVSQGTEGDPNSLSCMAMILNALGHDPQRTWKGLWRWNTAELLQSDDASKVSVGDVVDFAALARCKGAKATAFPCDSSQIDGLDTLRRELRAVCEDADGAAHLIAHFDRAALGLSGSGHFSPVAGYHEEKDMVLILDVDRRTCPPYWVSVRDLYRAMSSKGFVSVSTASEAETALCPLHITSWADAPLQSGDLAWQMTTRTARRRVWRQSTGCSRSRSEDARGLFQCIVGRGMDLLVLASAAERRNSMRVAEHGQA